jgi:ribosomal protein L7/L12
LPYVLAVFVLSEASLFIQRWSWPCKVVFYLVATSLIALVLIHQIHRRGQTIAQAIATSRAERRRLAEARTHAREAAGALPWLHDKRLSLDAVPGVLITPAPDVPGCHRTGYDIVLDTPGDQKLFVARQIMRLTRVHPKIAKDLVDSAPVTVLRVPDMAMAQAARTILEFAGATVSITDPASQPR